MYHKLDIHPIPADVLYVNELSLAGKVPYETKDDTAKAITGKKKSEGDILPDDNVRIYVPMDLNADIIMWRLYSLHGSLGYPTEKNESAYSSGVSKVISQLEIYDQVWAARKVGGDCAEGGRWCETQPAGNRAGKANCEVSGRQRRKWGILPI